MALLWQDVEPGWVVSDGEDLYVVTDTMFRADDGHHPFLVVHVYCLTNEKIGGSHVYSPFTTTQTRRSAFYDLQWDEVWRTDESLQA